MNILWVPHTSRNRSGVRSRSTYFIERVAAKHCVHEMCWDVPIRRTPAGLVSTLSSWRREADGVTLHHLPRIPTPPGPVGRLAARVNERVFHWLMHRVVRECSVDVVICSCNWYALGFPPTDLQVPLVLDYFDILSEEHEARYFANCEAVLCSSSVMHDRAQRYAVPSHYLPNGVDTQRFCGLDAVAAKRRYGLDGRRVVSLIGLTASERLYFVDAIELVARRVPDVCGVMVGDGKLLPAIRAAIRGRERWFAMLGPRPYDEIPALFACTDVGLYPGDEGPQFQAALPIKVLEYTAAGRPVVTAPLEELSRLGFPNVHFAEPTAEAFADAICRALGTPPPPVDVSAFDIGTLSERLVAIVEGVVADWPRCRAARGRAGAGSVPGGAS